MSDYDEFLAEHNRQREEQIKHQCKKGVHNWKHGYGFAACSLCGIDQEDFVNGKKPKIN